MLENILIENIIFFCILKILLLNRTLPEAREHHVFARRLFFFIQIAVIAVNEDIKLEVSSYSPVLVFPARLPLPHNP